MTSGKLIFYPCILLVLIFIPLNLKSQGIVIQSGGRIESLGNTTIEISNGNFDNSGIFSEGTGSVTFKGTAGQQIKSGGASFYDVVFNNTATGNADINISDPMIITGTATFTSGILYFSNSGSLYFAPGSAASQGNTGSFVNGPVSKAGTSAFVYRTGAVSGNNAVWAPAAIAAPSSSSVITVQYVFSPSDHNQDPLFMCNTSILNHTSGVEYWTFSTNNEKPDVTLYWKDGSRSGIVSTNDLQIARWNGACWESMGSSNLTGNAGSGSLSNSLAFTSYGIMTFGTIDYTNLLPVEITAMKATCNKGKIEISWSTSSETNNAHFMLERSSDAENWENIGTIPGAGNSNQVRNYHFSDTEPLDGTAYYRIRQRDYNGNNKVFSPFTTNCNEIKPVAKAYPNPFTNELTLDVENISNGEVTVIIRDLTGRCVWNKSLINGISKSSQALSLGQLETGVYLLEIISGDFTTVQKISKQ